MVRQINVSELGMNSFSEFKHVHLNIASLFISISLYKLKLSW